MDNESRCQSNYTVVSRFSISSHVVCDCTQINTFFEVKRIIYSIAVTKVRVLPVPMNQLTKNLISFCSVSIEI